VVNLVHSDGEDHLPVDFRIYAKQLDGKTKNEHFREMLTNAVHNKGLEAETILFDSWYASWENLKLVHRLNRIFITKLKSNRLVSVSEDESYQHLDDIDWTEDRLQNDMMVKPQYMKCEPSLLVKNTNYVLLRRLSAKEEARRLVAAPFIAEDYSSEFVGLENHLNYIRCCDREMLI